MARASPPAWWAGLVCTWLVAMAILPASSRTFLERLGLPSLDHLPPIAEFIPSADVVETLESGLRLDTDIITEPVADADG